MRTYPGDKPLVTAGNLIKRGRIRARLTQDELGEKAGFTGSWVSVIERGRYRPPPGTLERLVEPLSLTPPQREALWACYEYELPAAPPPDAAIPHTTGVPPVGTVHGRERELATLEKWIDRDATPIVGLRGIGGIGKSTLAAALCARLDDRFERVRWLTLNPTTAAADALRSCLRSLVGQGGMERSGDGAPGAGHPDDGTHEDAPAALAEALAAHLREHRCLLVLDQVEAVLAPGTPPGTFQTAYEACAALIEAVGNALGATTHGPAPSGAAPASSCLVLVGRELPRVRRWADDATGSPHFLSLTGVATDAAQRILADGGLTGTEARRRALIARYAGHPLALKLVAGTTRELFGGDLDRFLAASQDQSHGLGVPGAVHDLLDREFARLSPRERDLVYWLAIEREPVALQTLAADLIPRVDLMDIVDALTALHERSLVEFHSPAASTLHPLALDHFTDRIIAEIAREITTGNSALFASHALLKAQAPDNIRETQARLVVTPLLKQLRDTLGMRELERRLRAVLADQRNGMIQPGGYTAGNALNLLHALGCSLSGVDASGLVVRQAYLRDVDLAGASFAGADLETCVFSERRGAALSLAWCARTGRLAAGTMGGAIVLWDTVPGAPAQRLGDHHGWVGVVAFSPDGQWLASGGDDHQVRVWDLASGEPRHILRAHSDHVRGLAFSPGGQLLATASDDHAIRLWDLERGGDPRCLEGHADRVRALAFNSNGWQLASGSDDHTITLWDVRTGGRIGRMEDHQEWVRALAFSPDGKVLASGSGDQTVRLWDPYTYKHIRTLPRRESAIWSLAFSPDGRSLVIGLEDHGVQIWGTDGTPGPVLAGHHDRVRAVVYSPDGRLVASASDDQTIRLWDSATGERRGNLSGYRHDIWQVAYDPDGRLFALSRASGAVVVREVVAGALVPRFGSGAGRGDRVGGDRVVCATRGPGGRLVAIAGADGTIRVRETETGHVCAVLPGGDGRVRALAFSPDERFLASAGDDAWVRLWDVGTSDRRADLQEHDRPVHALAFSPDSEFLVSGGDDGRVCLWETMGGTPVWARPGHPDRVRAVAFSPDGSRIACGGADRSIQVWDAATGGHLATLTSHTDWVRALVFLSGGQLLASAGDDHSVRLWDLGEPLTPDADGATGLRTQASKAEVSLAEAARVAPGPHAITHSTVLGTHDDRVWSLACAPDGTTLASGAEDGTIALWDVPQRARTATVRADRPYERLNITSATGLTAGQRSALKSLGAYEDE